MEQQTRSGWLRVIVAAAVVALMVAAAGVGGALAATVLGDRFDDVDAGDTHAEAIGWLADAGVTAGCTPEEYCPTDAVTRAQMATFMRRLAGGDGDVAPVVEAAHALQADWADDAGDADTLQGMGPAELQTMPAVVNRWQHVHDDTLSETFDVTGWEKLRDLGDPVAKEHDGTDLRMRLTTHMERQAGWSCALQLRVDGENRLGEQELDGSEAVLQNDDATAVHLDVLFEDLDAGEHQVELWLRGGPDGPEDAECMENPGGYQRLLVVEEIPGV